MAIRPADGPISLDTLIARATPASRPASPARPPSAPARSWPAYGGTPIEQPRAIVLVTTVATCDCGATYRLPNSSFLIRYDARGLMNSVHYARADAETNPSFVRLPRETKEHFIRVPFCEACFAVDNKRSSLGDKRMSDTGYTMPSLFDLPPDHPSRQSWQRQMANLQDKMDRIEHSLSSIVQGNSYIMSALTNLTDAVGDVVDEIDQAVQQMSNHPNVQNDGALASLTQKLRNASAAMKDAIAAARPQPETAGPPISSATDVGSSGTVASGGTVTSTADAGTGLETLQNSTGSPTTENTGTTGSTFGSTSSGSVQGPSTTRRAP